jgi:hypothetical protein
MRKWLRGWFVWRFGLRRLVVATVFLGIVVGLNFRTIGPMGFAYYEIHRHMVYLQYWRGWPLPFLAQEDEIDTTCTDSALFGNKVAEQARLAKAMVNGEPQGPLPLIYQTYRFAGNAPFRLLIPEAQFCLSTAIIDALLALTVLFLILFLQIPRRQAEKALP